MNNLRFLTLFLAFGFTSSQFAAGQEGVKVVLTVVEIDKTGERPAVDKEVTIIPKNQGVSFGRTNLNGQIAFSFPSTESVTFRVGEIGNDVRLQPLSGRTNQNTSFLIDKRSRTTTQQYTVEVNSRDRALIFETSNGFSQLLDDLKLQAGGRLMNKQSRDYVLSLKPAIVEAMTPNSSASDFLRLGLADAKSQLLAELDDLLKAPFRMGANATDSAFGSKINSVQQGGPADIAGLRPGDIITHVNLQSVVDSPQTFGWMIANAAESKTKLKVKRGNSELRIEISLIR